MIRPGKSQDSLPNNLRNLYLQRYAWPGPSLPQEPPKNTSIIVVIPCFNEPKVLQCLEALCKCDTPVCHVEVLVVVNHGEKAPEEIKSLNFRTVEILETWIKDHVSVNISFHLIRGFDLPDKHAGVGLARKIGMDEAVRRFEFLHNKKGIIVSFDADCQCSQNYLQEIHRFYLAKPETNAALVYFEHPLKGEFHNDVYEGILNYELHLRYYRNALVFAGFPHAFHTIGSCITVTSGAYQKQGGMNKRKAGEDFYFLQKVFMLGNIGNINSAKVIPSPRASDRVPFGTGRAIRDFLRQKTTGPGFTYNPATFMDLSELLERVPMLYEDDTNAVMEHLPDSIQEYANAIHFKDRLLKIKKNCASGSNFEKSFYSWFNGFTVLKYVHFAKEHYYQRTEILKAVNWLLSKVKNGGSRAIDKKQTLFKMRALDKLQ